MSVDLHRTAFSTSRQLDFLSVKELTLQCGYGPDDWQLVAIKELVDNELDALEEQGIAPEITITIDEQSITVAGNGTRIPPDVVDQMLDFTVRISSREAYVAPDRGAQGNALKTIVAMPFVLDGDQGRVDIAGGGVLNEIVLKVDRIRQQPVASIDRSCKSGSFVRVYMSPFGASSEDFDEDDKDERFLQIADLARNFACLNPHLTLTVESTDWEIRSPCVMCALISRSRWSGSYQCADVGLDGVHFDQVGLVAVNVIARSLER